MKVNLEISYKGKVATLEEVEVDQEEYDDIIDDFLSNYDVIITNAETGEEII